MSVLGLLAVLLYVYASLPEDVIISQAEGNVLYGGREGVFYAVLITITLINALVFVMGSIYKNDNALRSWFNGLMVVMNIFFVIALLLLFAINSNERFNFESVGFMVYGSVILVAVWAISWPIYFLIRKFSGKVSV